MKVAVSGTRDGQPWPGIGKLAELADHVAADLCAAGIAEPVAEPDRDVEKAVAPGGAEERAESSPLTTDTAAPVAKRPAARKGRPRP